MYMDHPTRTPIHFALSEPVDLVVIGPDQHSRIVRYEPQEAAWYVEERVQLAGNYHGVLGQEFRRDGGRLAHELIELVASGQWTVTNREGEVIPPAWPAAEQAAA